MPDGSINTTFEKQYTEVTLQLPKSVDMEYCSKIVVKAKSEAAPITIKFYGEERFEEKTTGELFAHWRCQGNGVAEYVISPIADGNVAGIGIMAIDEYTNFDATVYSVTFYVKADYAEKLSAPSVTAKPTMAPTATPTPVPTKALSRTAMTGLTAREIVDEIILGWNLGNTLDSNGDYMSYESSPLTIATGWGNDAPTLEQFKAVKAAGFNAVRIPVTWYQQTKYDASTDTYVIKDDWMAYVKKTVDYAYYLDLIVILNTHHEAWIEVPEFTSATYATASKMMEDIWAQIATTFADYDQGLIFEGMNEPREKGSAGEWSNGDADAWNYLNDLNTVFVNTVRNQGSSSNKERLLMLTGYTAGADKYDAIRAIEIPANAGNVAISVHGYTPYTFCMTVDNPANFHFPGTNAWGENYETTLTNLFANLKKIAKEKGVPFIMGEFGAVDNNNTEDRVRWASYYLNLAKDAGIPCFWWDNQGLDGYGLLHRRSKQWFENSVPVLEAMLKVYNREGYVPKYVIPKKTGFSWNDIPIGKDWIELYRSENGEKLGAWANISINNWRQYLNENYKIVLIYDSVSEPSLVLQGGWYHIKSSGYSNNAYVLPFHMRDVNMVLESEKINLNNMRAFYVSAGGETMTLYGLYAVPVK